MRTTALACLILATLLATPDRAASAPPDPEKQRNELRAAMDRVRRETGGRILSAQVVGRGSRSAYRIKVLTPSGQVRVIQVPVEKQR